MIHCDVRNFSIYDSTKLQCDYDVKTSTKCTVPLCMLLVHLYIPLCMYIRTYICVYSWCTQLPTSHGVFMVQLPPSLVMCIAVRISSFPLHHCNTSVGAQMYVLMYVCPAIGVRGQVVVLNLHMYVCIVYTYVVQR